MKGGWSSLGDESKLEEVSERQFRSEGKAFAVSAQPRNEAGENASGI